MEIREALSAAMDAAETTTETAAPVTEAQTTTPAPVADVPPASTAAAPSVASEGRDEKGRFKPKTASATPAPAKAEESASPPPAAPEKAETATEAPKPAEVTPTLKAPQSWKPAAREKWAALPPETQAEVWRREKEVAHVLQESAVARKTATEFEETIRPYVPLFQAEGAAPIKAIGNMLQTVAALARGAPAQKAAVVAQLIKAYSVDIGALDSVLSGEAQATPHTPAEYRDPRVDILMQQLQAQQRNQTQAVQQKAAQEVEAAKGELEFLDDVREDMADLIEVASRRGVELSLKDAYTRAVAMNGELSAILEQRKAAQAAETANAATQRAKAASSSVRSSPAPVSRNDGPGDDIRSHLEAAFAAQSRR